MMERQGKYGGPDLNRRPSARQALGTTSEELLTKFREFLKVDLRRSDRTAYEHTYYVKKFLDELPRPVESVTSEDARGYLKGLTGSSPAKYKNVLMALKVFFRDFLEMPKVVSSFRFPHQFPKPKQVPTKDHLKSFFECLEAPKEKALFLLYATTGLRRQEILTLKPEDIDFEKRMITPDNHKGETKKSWVSFYNEEAEKALEEYTSIRKHTRSTRFFPMAREEEKKLWRSARDQTGLNVTPQRLREWFCCELGSLGVQDRYIDAFCGRVPKSVLARHYSDYSPERLKEIYGKADLRVLS